MAVLLMATVVAGAGLGCHTQPQVARDRLVAEIDELARVQPLRKAVLTQAAAIVDPRLANVGARHLDDGDSETQLYAFLLSLNDAAARNDTLVAGLASANRHVRKAAARKAADTGSQDNGQVDAALRSSIETEGDGSVFGTACESYVRRNGSAGAAFVYDVACTRSTEWRVLVAEALALRPEERFAEVFAEAMATREYGLWGRRGLLAVGRLRDENLLARAKKYGTERSVDEYHEEYDRHEEGLGGLQASTLGAMFQDLSAADVVILAETHKDPFVRAWQVGILQPLSVAWGGPANIRLVYESIELQAPLVAAAEELGIGLVECEPDLTQTQRLRMASGWNLEDRDVEIVARCRTLCMGSTVRTVIVYGRAHTVILAEALQQSGLRVSRVVLAPSMRTRAGVMLQCGTLNVRDKVFRYADGTYVVFATPYSVWGCPQLDWALEERAHAAESVVRASDDTARRSGAER